MSRGFRTSLAECAHFSHLNAFLLFSERTFNAIHFSAPPPSARLRYETYEPAFRRVRANRECNSVFEDALEIPETLDFDGLPLGSKKNIVRCSPAPPRNGLPVGCQKQPPPLNAGGQCLPGVECSTTPRWGIITMWFADPSGSGRCEGLTRCSEI